METTPDTQPAVKTNLEVKTTRARKTVKKSTSAERLAKRATKAETPVDPVKVNSFYLVAFPVDTTIEIDRDEMVSALNSISNAIVSIKMPPRFINGFTRSATGVKILPLPSSTTPVQIKLRDSFSDKLVNSLDYVAEHKSKCTVYGIHVKRARPEGKICQITIFQGIEFKSFTYTDGLDFDKNHLQFIDSVISCTGLFEATTKDLPDLQKYVTERFSL